MNLFQQQGINFQYYIPYYSTAQNTQPSTIENIPSYHSTSQLPDEKDKETDVPTTQNLGQVPEKGAIPPSSNLSSSQNLTSQPTHTNSNQQQQPQSIAVKVENPQSIFNPEFLQTMQTFLMPQNNNTGNTNNNNNNPTNAQQQLLSLFQTDLFLQEYTTPQLCNMKDQHQKLQYNNQLVQSIQGELDRVEQKLNIPSTKLNNYYEIFFQKKGNAFSEKFSKPRPMSYKQNQSVLLKKEQQNQKNSSSKFHNMTKLLMYTFLQMFGQENLESLGLPDYIQFHLKKLAKNIKLSGKKPKGPHNVIKTDCFNHAHYNALFLILTPENIKELAKQEREVEVHLTCFGIDLSEKPAVDQQKVAYVNIIKRFTYLVVKNSIGELAVEGTSNTRTEYLQRAMIGINKLNQGNMIQRF